MVISCSLWKILRGQVRQNTILVGLLSKGKKAPESASRDKKRRFPLMSTKSAAKKRANAKQSYDAYLANCPSRQLLRPHL